MDTDSQELLPASLRRTWAAVPRDTLYQIFLVGLILGAGTGVSIVGMIVGSRLMMFGFPLALVVAKLQNWLFPWERKALSELHRHRSRSIFAPTETGEDSKNF